MLCYPMNVSRRVATLTLDHLKRSQPKEFPCYSLHSKDYIEADNIFIALSLVLLDEDSSINSAQLL